MSEQSVDYSIEVITEPAYVEEQSRPEEDRYVFAYTITIRNTGRIAAQLQRRHWYITDGDGHVQEVSGAGVVGEQPHLGPGESFRYTSGAVLETPVGYMEGTYTMVADDGTEFEVGIPGFTLSTPNALH